MQIFISEYLTCGAWTGRVSESLVNEGLAMLSAFATDAARIADVNVITTWDRRLGRFPLDGIDAHVVGSCDEEARLFTQFAQSSDAVMVIAPETENILLERYDATRQADARGFQNVASSAGLCSEWIGASRNAIQLTTDKLECSRRLRDCGVSTIPTVSLSAVSSLPNGRVVIKPRDGAGAEDTFVVNDTNNVAALSLGRTSDDYVAQPFFDGDSVSCFCVVGEDATHIFPTVRQTIFRTLERDGERNGLAERMRYHGGEMPVEIDLRELVENGLAAIGAEQGHFGVDILIPDNGRPPMIIEFNPRLTTSYVGYREVMDDNVAERILFPHRFDAVIKTNGRRVRFDSSGKTWPSKTAEEH